MADQNLVKVKSTLGKKPDGGFPLAFYERNEDHPDGEAYIADDQVHAIAPTSAAMQALHAGTIKKAEAGEAVGDTFEPDLNPDQTVQVTQDDSAGDLEDRYSKDELKALAEAQGLTVKAGDTKADIAEAIIDKRDNS